MDLHKAAKAAMKYLDSVGVAAEYDIVKHSYRVEQLKVFTDDYIISITSNAPAGAFDRFISRVKAKYQQKSPA